MKSKVSHTYIKFYDVTLGIEMVAHSDFIGVVIVPLSKFVSDNIPIEEFEIIDPSLDASLRKNMRFIGRKYDFMNLIGWVPVLMFKNWFRRKIRNPLDDPQRMICVDFCLHITNDANATSLPYNILNPQELLKWFRDNYEKNKWTRKVLDNPHTILDDVKAVLATEVMKSDEQKQKDNWTDST